MNTALAWIAGNDTGTSSKAIWSHMMTGVPPVSNLGVGHPVDPDDFGRCYRLLLVAPEWEARLGEMGRYSAEWKALAARWADLREMYERAVGDPTRKPYEAKVDKAAWGAMYRTMDLLLTSARVCVDCGRVGMNGWTTYPNDTKRCHDCAKRFDAKGSAGRHRTSVRLDGATVEFGS